MSLNQASLWLVVLALVSIQAVYCLDLIMNVLLACLIPTLSLPRTRSALASEDKTDARSVVDPASVSQSTVLFSVRHSQTIARPFPSCNFNSLETERA